MNAAQVKTMSFTHQLTVFDAATRVRSYVLILAALVPFAMPVCGQETQQATRVEPAISAESTSSSSEVAPTGTDKHYKKPITAPANKVIAEKARLWPKETKPASVDNSTDATQTTMAAHEDTAELAKKLSNPISSLISFPIQTNFDFRMGTGSGWRNTTNVQPVIPVALNKDWNMISRTIVPIIHQANVTGPGRSESGLGDILQANVTAPGASQSGLGDVVQSLFFSPNKSEPFIWGVGPAILIPTATNSFLGSKQLGLGPTVVVLKQQHGWTVGTLWNHIWRVAGGSGRPKVNSDFIQPFLTYGTKDGWTYSVNTESSYDWTRDSWSVPVHFTVTKVVRFGKQPMSFAGAIRCWATSPTGGPEGCGLRIVVTALFPKKG